MAAKDDWVDLVPPQVVDKLPQADDVYLKQLQKWCYGVEAASNFVILV